MSMTVEQLKEELEEVVWAEDMIKTFIKFCEANNIQQVKRETGVYIFTTVSEVLK